MKKQFLLLTLIISFFTTNLYGLEVRDLNAETKIPVFKNTEIYCLSEIQLEQDPKRKTICISVEKDTAKNIKFSSDNHNKNLIIEFESGPDYTPYNIYYSFIIKTNEFAINPYKSFESNDDLVLQEDEEPLTETPQEEYDDDDEIPEENTNTYGDPFLVGSIFRNKNSIFLNSSNQGPWLNNECSIWH